MFLNSIIDDLTNLAPTMDAKCKKNHFLKLNQKHKDIIITVISESFSAIVWDAVLPERGS